MKHIFEFNDIESLTILAALNDEQITCMDNDNMIDASLCEKVREKILEVVTKDLDNKERGI